MKFKDLVNKYSFIDSKGYRQPKLKKDLKEKLIWKGKKITGSRTMLKKEINLLKPKVTSKDGGNEYILDTKISYIVINTKYITYSNCTLKLSTPKGLTLNECLDKCNYLMKFILINEWIFDAIDVKENINDHLKKLKIKSYQKYRNYFIINL
tara:strand:+ start:677 stop:1132 length:456 start_codon:yes stop_codon:yes gene_type:complete